MATTNENNFLPPSVGTMLKIGITANIGDGIHLSDVDFSCTFYNENRANAKQQFSKSQMIEIDDDNYMGVVDTKILGTGKYGVILDVDVPDDNVEGGYRKEVVRFSTGIKVVN